MFKRTLTAAAVAGALVAATPGLASATVSNNPTGGYPSFNGTVVDLVRKGSTVYVAGDFSSVGGKARDGLAAIDVSSGRVLSWSPTVTGHVNSLTVRKEGVYLAGNFKRVNGKRRTDVARVDRTTGRNSGFKHTISGKVNTSSPAQAFTVTTSRTRVYVGGQFTKADGRTRYSLAAFSRTGNAIRGWHPKASQGEVTDLVVKKNGVYVAGFFHRLNDQSRKFLALVNDRNGATKKSFASKVPNVVLDIASVKGDIYVGTGGKSGGGALKVDRTSGNIRWERRFDGDVAAVSYMRREVYIGGHFTHLCRDGNQDPVGGACRDGSVTVHRGVSLKPGKGGVAGWRPDFNPNSPGQGYSVNAIALVKKSERLIAGGNFTSAGSRKMGRFAVFN